MANRKDTETKEIEARLVKEFNEYENSREHFWFFETPKFVAAVATKEICKFFSTLGGFLDQGETPVSLFYEEIDTAWGKDADIITREDEKIVTDFILENLEESSRNKYRYSMICKDETASGKQDSSLFLRIEAGLAKGYTNTYRILREDVSNWANSVTNEQEYTYKKFEL